eukprot:5480248-Prymnesium_polylepis.1
MALSVFHVEHMPIVTPPTDDGRVPVLCLEGFVTLCARCVLAMRLESFILRLPTSGASGTDAVPLPKSRGEADDYTNTPPQSAPLCLSVVPLGAAEARRRWHTTT